MMVIVEEKIVSVKLQTIAVMRAVYVMLRQGPRIVNQRMQGTGP